MHCISVDIIEVGRIEKAIAHWGERFLERMYTGKELQLCQNQVADLAARFAAKELELEGLAISLSHCREYAVASVIGETL